MITQRIRFITIFEETIDMEKVNKKIRKTWNVRTGLIIVLQLFDRQKATCEMCIHLKNIAK